MARNREKANLMFNRWTTMTEELEKGPRSRRPFLASECKDQTEAEKWRREIIRDVARKVAEIQNAGLGEARLRDLNDEINKLLREKGHWERQIVALGGPNYAKSAPKVVEEGSGEGVELPGSGGYRYFGAAKDLPGVKELFASATARSAARRTRGEIFRGITPDYYGYRDDDDGVLVAAEAAAQAVLVADAVAAYEGVHGPGSSSSRGGRGGVKRRAPATDAVGGCGDAVADEDGGEDGAPLMDGEELVVGVLPPPVSAAAAAAAAVAGGMDADAAAAGAAADAASAGGGGGAPPSTSAFAADEALLVERRRQLLLAKYIAPALATAAAAAPPPPPGGMAVETDA